MFSGIKEKLLPWFIGGSMGALLGATGAVVLENALNTPNHDLSVFSAMVFGLILANKVERRYNANRIAITE